MSTRAVETFGEAYRRAGLPEQDRTEWVQVLLRYPLDRERQRGFPTEDDQADALAALKANHPNPDHDQVHTLAWRHCVAREGERLLGKRDAHEVARYVTAGGTPAEAFAYLDAVADARCPGNDVWTVWARFEACFSTTRFQLYRRMGVTPTDLAAFVAAGWFTQAWDVQQVHRWGRQMCPDAPFLVTAAYQAYGLTADEVPVWENRRKAGDDVVSALKVLAALAANT